MGWWIPWLADASEVDRADGDADRECVDRDDRRRLRSAVLPSHLVRLPPIRLGYDMKSHVATAVGDLFKFRFRVFIAGVIDGLRSRSEHMFAKCVDCLIPVPSGNACDARLPMRLHKCVSDWHKMFLL
jgi:hypothetical protein